MGPIVPEQLDLQRNKGLSVRWADGAESFYPIAYLRVHSPSAEMRELRKEMAKNPLAVLPAGMFGGGELRATAAELVGNYAIKIEFSDGHRTGIYTWEYLREIDPGRGADGSGEDAPG